MKKLPRSFYEQETIHVAQKLLRHHLVYYKHGVQRISKIIEVEAYLGQHDLACHASKGITPRTQIVSKNLKTYSKT